MSASAAAAGSGRGAAFFDVDGTLTATTIAHYYAYFMRKRLPPGIDSLWFATFVARCGWYKLLDSIDRSMCNRIFYRNYRGLDAEQIRRRCVGCHHEVIRPRLFEPVQRCVQDHRAHGRLVVFVTGSIDFIVAPLAHELNVEYVLAPSLVEIGGRFTGDLTGPPLGEREKARRLRMFADTHGVDLTASYGYGDSISDLPMLESVASPHAVNPDRALAATAAERHWPILRWTVRPRASGKRR